MTVERIVVDGLGRLPQFAHAAIAGDLVFVSGTLGTTDGLTLADGIAAQTTQTLHNMGRILAEAGAAWDDVAKVSVFLADIDEFGAMNDAYGSFFVGTPPARITVAGADLALGAQVEMECIAERAATRSTTRSTLGGVSIRRDSGFVEHDDERLFYEDCGPVDAPVLVLSHGAGGNHAIWFQQVAHFARERRVITWDHRSYGRSTDRADLSGPLVAPGDLLAILDHLGISEADFVGQSMGGWTATGVALERPAMVRRIIYADTLGGFISDDIAAMLSAPAEVPAGRLGAHPALDPEFSRRQPERAHLYQSLGLMGSADPDKIISRLFATLHGAEEAARIRVPVLCIVGDRDPLFPPEAVRAVGRMLPDARVSEIPNTGHSPYYEAPEAWNAVVTQFLDT